jgi:hypothetical protein
LGIYFSSLVSCLISSWFFLAVILKYVFCTWVSFNLLYDL